MSTAETLDCDPSPMEETPAPLGPLAVRRQDGGSLAGWAEPEEVPGKALHSGAGPLTPARLGQAGFHPFSCLLPASFPSREALTSPCRLSYLGLHSASCPTPQAITAQVHKYLLTVLIARPCTA